MPISLPDLAPMLGRFAERDAADPEMYPAANIAELHDGGFIRAPFPERLGGMDWTLRDSVAFIEALAASSASTALIAAMPIGLAAVYGAGPEIAPPEHRESWAAQAYEASVEYRKGGHYAACNSEKGAGGALSAISTVARRDPDGSFRLSGEKILASGGRFATKFFSTAKIDPLSLRERAPQAERSAGVRVDAETATEAADGPVTSVVEVFLIDTDAPGVTILDDWDGFGMRSTESQTVRFQDAGPATLIGFPNFIEIAQPFPYWFCLFAAIPLGCARAILRSLETPVPQSPALRLRLTDALMRYESLRAYLFETAADWRYQSGPGYRARVTRTKTYVTQESTKLAAELFALSGGRNYRRSAPAARALADSFAGTALRPPLLLGLETLLEGFGQPED